MVNNCFEKIESCHPILNDKLPHGSPNTPQRSSCFGTPHPDAIEAVFTKGSWGRIHWGRSMGRDT